MPAGKKKTSRKKTAPKKKAAKKASKKVGSKAKKTLKRSSKKTTKKAGKKTARKTGAKSAAKKKVNYVPPGTQDVIPYITVRGGVSALDFYKKAFGAKEKGRLLMPDGKLAHGEMQIGDCRIMLADEDPNFGNQSPQSLNGSPVGICIYVRNVDAFFERALKAGARVDRPVVDQFFGDRSGTLVDPFGHKWTISTHKEDVSFREMGKRMAKLYGGG